MNLDKHKIRLPLSDYNELLKAEQVAKEKIEKNREHMEKLHNRSREFVSALHFMEDKGLLEEFNKKMGKSYKLQSVGKDIEYKMLVNDD